MPCERTFSRVLAWIDSEELQQGYSDWMASLDPSAVKVLHLDGKVLRNADHTQREDHCQVRHPSSLIHLFNAGTG